MLSELSFFVLFAYDSIPQVDVGLVVLDVRLGRLVNDVGKVRDLVGCHLVMRQSTRIRRNLQLFTQHTNR